MDNKLWLVEWLRTACVYRVSKFVAPHRTIAFEDSWQEAVKNIRDTYGIDGLIIFIRKSDGTVDYFCETDYV